MRAHWQQVRHATRGHEPAAQVGIVTVVAVSDIAGAIMVAVVAVVVVFALKVGVVVFRNRRSSSSCSVHPGREGAGAAAASTTTRALVLIVRKERRRVMRRCATHLADRWQTSSAQNRQSPAIGIAENRCTDTRKVSFFCTLLD
jgi:hypothetical protein